MIARALIVLLLVLNLGVATWWALRPASFPSSAPATTAGAPRLTLLREVALPTHFAAPAAKAGDATNSVPSTVPAAAQRCMSFGPFTDAAALASARTTLQSQVAQLQVRQTVASSHGWRVWLPPLADRVAAQVMAARITAVGFKDYYIVGKGDETNSIALGRFGNEASARRQQAALVAAGIDAQAESLAAPASWIDVTATDALDADALRIRIHASQVHSLDCPKQS